MKKVATYVRVDNPKNESCGVDDQQQLLKDFCDAKGYDVCDSVVSDGEAAYSMLMGLLRSAKEKGIETVVMTSRDRITGTVDELSEVAKAFEESDVVVELIDGSHNPYADVDIIMNIISCHNED